MRVIVAMSAMVVPTLFAPQVMHGQAAAQLVKSALRVVAANAVPLSIGVAAGGVVAWSEVKKHDSYNGQNTVYSINFETTKGQGIFGYLFGARTFGKPDIFLVIEIEGRDRFVVPHRTKNYTGQQILETVLLDEIPYGRKVIINIYDDRATSNQFWSDLLSQKIDYFGNGDVGALVGAKTTYIPLKLESEFKVALSARVKGQFRMVSPNLEIVRPTWICSAEFIIPRRETIRIPGRTLMGIPYEFDKTVVQPWTSRAIFWENEKAVGKMSLSMLEVRS